MVTMLKIPRQWAGRRMAKNLLVVAIVLTFIFFFFVWRLGTLTPGLSPHEAAAREASSSFSALLENPVDAPHKVFQLILQTAGYDGAFWMRSVSVFFGLLFLLGLYLTLRTWFGRSIAFCGALLFATTPWIILSTRSAATDVMLYSPVLLIFALIVLSRSNKRLNLVWIGFIAALTICIYTPGVLWFMLLALAFGHKKILPSILKVKSVPAILGIAALILLLIPLFYASIQNITVAKNLLLIPDSFPGPGVIFKNVLDALASLAYSLPEHVDYAIAKQPILNIAQVVLAVIGIFSMWKKAKRELYIILLLLITGFVAVGLNADPFLIGLCLPAIIILDAAGLRYLFVKWFSVFPLNPLARGFAVVLICLLLMAQVAYGATYALIAWPHNLETRKTYVIH